MDHLGRIALRRGFSVAYLTSKTVGELFVGGLPIGSEQASDAVRGCFLRVWHQHHLTSLKRVQPGAWRHELALFRSSCVRHQGKASDDEERADARQAPTTGLTACYALEDGALHGRARLRPRTDEDIRLRGRLRSFAGSARGSTA